MTSFSAFNSRLKVGFENLSPQLKEAARWVIDHPTDVALLSMRQQARRAGIAPATLTRLAQRFGLRGYDGLRKLFAEAVRQRPESYRGRAEELLVRRESEGDAALVQDIFASLSQHLQGLSLPGSIDRFTAAADIIASADRVFVSDYARVSPLPTFFIMCVRSSARTPSLSMVRAAAVSTSSVRSAGPTYCL